MPWRFLEAESLDIRAYGRCDWEEWRGEEWATNLDSCLKKKMYYENSNSVF